MYGQDTIETVYNEIAPLQKEIYDTGLEIKRLAEAEAKASADYELSKNTTLIELFAQETDKANKRTEQQRTAIYRERHSDKRLAKMLASNNLKATQDYLKALQASLMAVQTRAGMIKAEMGLTR